MWYVVVGQIEVRMILMLYVVVKRESINCGIVWRCNGQLHISAVQWRGEQWQKTHLPIVVSCGMVKDAFIDYGFVWCGKRRIYQFWCHVVW